MNEERIKYRKLPGRLRGLFRGASVWRGPDHLLLVKSLRFREEYRRFYFKDVQAIAVAKAPRFHISARLIPALFALLIASAFVPRLTFSVWPWVLGAGVLLLAAWVVVASQFSCRCRIYTAVSSEELPSVSRSWTARRFLARVEPLISAVQGTVQTDWAEQVDDRWWAEGGVDLPHPGVAQTAQRQTIDPAVDESTPVLGVCFAVALFFSATFDFFTLNGAAAWTRSVPLWFAVAKIAASTIIFIRYNGNPMSRRLRKLAIAELVALGLLFYASQIRTSVQAQLTKSKVVRVDTSGLVTSPVLRGIQAGADALIGLLTVIAVLRGERP